MWSATSTAPARLVPKRTSIDCGERTQPSRAMWSKSARRARRRAAACSGTLRAWLEGRRSPSRANLERIERVYRVVRRENVARNLTARLNRAGRGTSVEIRFFNQCHVSALRQRRWSTAG
ncbi:hypothetical protein [Streptomyces sennicomposti]